MKALEEKLTGLLTDHFGVAEHQITPDTSYEQLGLDSLVLIELTMIIKKELGVRLDDDVLQAGSTIADTAELIESNGARL